jgi:hypothetical protein
MKSVTQTPNKNDRCQNDQMRNNPDIDSELGVLPNYQLFFGIYLVSKLASEHQIGPIIPHLHHITNHNCCPYTIHSTRIDHKTNENIIHEYSQSTTPE